jgi:hypothetical protein
MARHLETSLVLKRVLPMASLKASLRVPTTALTMVDGTASWMARRMGERLVSNWALRKVRQMVP